MNFFKKFYEDIDLEHGGDEVKVLCPFHHDHSPSASVNTKDSLFYCYVCNWGGTEEQFVAKLNGISTREASKLLSTIQANPNNWETMQKVDLWADADFLSLVRSLGLSDQTIESLNLGLAMVNSKKFLGIPVFYNKMLVDIRRYNILKHTNMPKLIGNKDVQTGYVVPFDLWDKTEPTYIFEGEKDMLIAREVGLNAITLTGGAGALPNELMLPYFKDTELIICYDNDPAGKNGMEKLAKHLHEMAKNIKYIDISELVKEEKEDFYDYITKYAGNIFEFLAVEQKEFLIKQELPKKRATTTIISALSTNYIRQHLTSEVTVASEYAETYALPTAAKATKLNENEDAYEVMVKDENKTWFLDELNQEQLLQLIEVDAKETNVLGHIQRFMGIPKSEKNIDYKLSAYKTVYKCSVVDKIFDGSSISLDIYSFEKLQVGGQYIIDYKIYPHPTKHQKLVGICTAFESIGDNSHYIMQKHLLEQFSANNDSIDKHLDRLYQSMKHHVAKHLDFKLWLFVDLVFNSILEIKYGEVIPGALDVFILGDTQVGKSETTMKMTELYNFGKFLSLKTSTTIGLIGGSNKVDGSWANTIGAIPRQHKRLVIMEEFSGAKPDFIKTMTDIRSSKRLRLARASGELEVPCHLRMITISNPINDETGSPRFLETFPNGVIPIMELIKSAEDVARYDAFMLVPKRENRKNPFGISLKGTPISKAAYEHKAEWIASRQANNIIFEEGVEAYIWEQGETLNKKFECNFPVFGTTTPKKLARFSVALASLTLSTDESFENIIVTKEIVDYMVEFLTTVYTDHSFRLDAYKQEYDSYNEYTNEDIKALEKIYPANTILLDFLSKQSRTTRGNLKTISGLEGDKFNPVFNQLVTYKFIRINMETVYPTEKYRKVYPKINKRSTSSGVALIDGTTSTQYDV